MRITRGREVKELFWIFATGLLWSAGIKLGDFLAGKITLWKTEPQPGFAGMPDRALCPHCGRSLFRFSRTLYCQRCGYREDRAA